MNILTINCSDVTPDNPLLLMNQFKIGLVWYYEVAVFVLLEY